VIIKSRPLRKAAGLDQIVNEHSVYAGPILPDILAAIFNSILQYGHIPSAFQHGLIIPIPKAIIKTCPIHQLWGITLQQKILLSHLAENSYYIHYKVVSDRASVVSIQH
jgi:hypothetical protein